MSRENPSGPRPPGRSILLVEDSPDGREALRSLLSLLGHRVEVAADGVEGVRKALALRPEVALIDLGLPRLSGLEVARQLRQLPGLEDVLLVAITGYGDEQTLTACRAAGFDHHLVKPFDPAELEGLLRRPAPARA